MAAKDDVEGGDFDTPVYRLVLFFVLILVIDTTWELIDEHVTHTIRKRQHKGLVHAWEQLKFEVMALGLVSLLLVVFEVSLLHLHRMDTGATHRPHLPQKLHNRAVCI